MEFRTSKTEKMRTTATGKVGIGTAGPDHDLEIANGGTYSEIDAGEVQFTTGSFRDYKENIQPVVIEAILDKMATIPVTTYDFKLDFYGDEDSRKDRIGLIAEDFHQIFQRGSDKRLSGQEIQMALWLAVQELKAENEALQDENKVQQKAIDNLEKRLEKLEKRKLINAELTVASGGSTTREPHLTPLAAEAGRLPSEISKHGWVIPIFNRR